MDTRALPRRFDALTIQPSRTYLINSERVRCQRFGAAARREEGEYPSWIFDRRATPSQWQRSATLRAELWRAPGVVAPQPQSASAMLLRRALPAARQSLAHSFPIYEMGSRWFSATTALKPKLQPERAALGKSFPTSIAKRPATI